MKSSDTVAYERKSPSARSAISSSKRKIAFWLRSYSSCRRDTRFLSDSPRSTSNLNTQNKKAIRARIRPKAGIAIAKPVPPDNLFKLLNKASDCSKIDDDAWRTLTICDEFFKTVAAADFSTSSYSD